MKIARAHASLWLFKNYWGFTMLPAVEAYPFFAKALMICAAGDGVLSPEEKDWIMGYMGSLGTPDEVLEELQTFDPTGQDIAAFVAEFPSVYESRRAMVYDALRACYADGELAKGELTAVKSMATTFEVSAKEVDNFIHILEEETALTKRRLALTYPEGNSLAA